MAGVKKRNLALIFRVFNDDWEKESLGTNTNDSDSSINEIRNEKSEEEEMAVDFMNNEIVPLGVEGSSQKQRQSWFTFGGQRSPFLGRSSIGNRTLSNKGQLKSQFKNTEILEAFKDGNMNKLRAIFVDIKKGRRNAASLFKLRDSKKRSIVHLAS